MIPGILRCHAHFPLAFLPSPFLLAFLPHSIIHTRSHVIICALQRFVVFRKCLIWLAFVMPRLSSKAVAMLLKAVVSGGGCNERPWWGLPRALRSSSRAVALRCGRHPCSFPRLGLGLYCPMHPNGSDPAPFSSGAGAAGPAPGPQQRPLGLRPGAVAGGRAAPSAAASRGL